MKYTIYFLAVFLLAASISCTNAANSNQPDVLSHADTGSATGSNVSNNASPVKQETVPDAVVKELYKLHGEDKSPLYEKKDRAAVEKYFSKDFVKLIWANGKEPNLMNQLAIEGDALYGSALMDMKVKKLDVGKPQINGNKAVVPVSFEASGANNESEKGSLTYDLVKENTGWRIDDIKCPRFYTGSLVNTINSLKKLSAESDKEIDAEFTIIKPPFVGKRWFVTTPGASGSGTPQYYLTINSENYMFCGFVQVNQANNRETKEEVALGRFKKSFRCDFKNPLGGKHNYKVEGDSIYELDNNNQVIKSSDCCSANSESNENCECKGNFIADN